MTTYTNRKSGAVYTDLTPTIPGKFELTNANGEVITVSKSTLDRWYKRETTVDFTNADQAPEQTTIEEPKAEAPVAEPKKQLTGHQKIAAKNIKHAFNWTVGGLENSVSDGHMEALPPVEEMLDLVYSEAMTQKFSDGSAGGKAPEEMRFAGREFCRKYLARLFAQEGYAVPEGWVNHKAKAEPVAPGTVQKVTAAEFNTLVKRGVPFLDEDGKVVFGRHSRTYEWNPETGCLTFTFRHNDFEITDIKKGGN